MESYIISHHASGQLLEKYSDSCEIYVECFRSTVRISIDLMSQDTLLCKAAMDIDPVCCGTFRIRRGHVGLYRTAVMGVTSVLKWATSVVTHVLGKLR
jgi:hypothetical protein